MRSMSYGSARPQALAFLLVVVLIGLSAGCASQSGGGGRDPLAPQLSIKPEPLQPDDDPAPAVRADASDGEARPSASESQSDSEAEKLLQEDELGGLEETGVGPEVADPLEPYNRIIYKFNDKMYFWVLKPVAKGYRKVVPATARSGVRNFFYNVVMPIRLINNILQGKIEAAEAEWTRFLYNSTVGVLGFGNPAKKHPGLTPEAEDLGLTLGTYGIGNGFYIVWPFFGPSTLRDSFGLAGDFLMDPITYLPLTASIPLTGYDKVNTLSFRLGDYETLKKASFDPYLAIRNGYIQQRQAKLGK